MRCLLEQMGLTWGPSKPGNSDILSPSESTCPVLLPLQRTHYVQALDNCLFFAKPGQTHPHPDSDFYDIEQKGQPWLRGRGHCITARNLSGGFPGDEDRWHWDTGNREPIVRLCSKLLMQVLWHRKSAFVSTSYLWEVYRKLWSQRKQIW